MSAESPVEITWLGHNCWQIKTAGAMLLVDPFLDDSPTAPIRAGKVEADYLLVSHGHFDHIADAAPIALRTGATVIAAFEVCQWLREKHGVKNCCEMNIGGACSLPFGKVKMTPAWHSSQLPDGSYGGNPGGFLLSLGDGAARKTIYFAGDTALFSDMKIISSARIDLAVLPIGDKFTMGPDDSIEAIKLLAPKKAAPSHYNTWPPIAQDGDGWAKRVAAETQAEPIVLEPGQSFVL